MAGLILITAWFMLSIISLITSISYKRENDIIRFKIREMLDEFTIKCQSKELNDTDKVIFDTLVKDRTERLKLDAKLRVWLTLSILSMWLSLIFLIIAMGKYVTF